MSKWTPFAAVLTLLLAACSSAPPAAESRVTAYENAQVFSNGQFAPATILTADGYITAVGAPGSFAIPAEAQRVDLAGKYVVPAFIDAHAHLGWSQLKTGEIGASTYTKDNLADHLRRAAYYGIAATRNLGIDPGEAIYDLRANPLPGAALILTAGRGIAMPNAGPGREYWRPVAYGVASEAEARRAVQELAGKKVDIVKIWVDDRNGTVPKLTPALRRAIIDEAHKHGLKVAAHIFYLEDAKDLLRAGIDGFAHGVRDRDIDDEFVTLIKSRPEVWVIPNLPENPDAPPDYAFMAQTLPAAEIEKLKNAAAARTPAQLKEARDFFGIQSRNLGKLNAAGVKIAFGTDSSNEVGWNVHSELADMVASGMTPAQALTAATQTSAEITGLVNYGVIGPKSGSYVVLDANPLDNIANTKKISTVVVRSQTLDRTAMSQGWTQ